MNVMKKITLEEHLYPSGFQLPEAVKLLLAPEYLARMSTLVKDVEQYRLPEMDTYGIAMQVLSLPIGIQTEADATRAIRRAKQANEGIAEVVRQHPTRFAGLATLPLQNPKAAADELERAVTQLGLKGAMVNGHTNGMMLDEQPCWTVWERAEALRVPVYLHPGLPLPGQVNKLYEGYPQLLGPAWDWGVETGTYALRLIFSGVLDAFPQTTIILGHMGEMLPFVLWRLDARAKFSTGKMKIKKLPSQYIKENIMITTSGQFSSDPLLCAVATMGADRILFAVDYPFESTKEATHFIETAPISEVEKDKICHVNTERLLKL
jgi:2,3-dihydroxybenzoate decarboxylase